MVSELGVFMIGFITLTGLLAGIVEASLKKWFGDQLKRGLLAYDGKPPKGLSVWERVYWQYEQRPRFVGALLEMPTLIWCAAMIASIIPFDLWQRYLVLYITLVTTLFLGYSWAHASWEHRRIHAQVEYIRTKEELEKAEKML